MKECDDIFKSSSLIKIFIFEALLILLMGLELWLPVILIISIVIILYLFTEQIYSVYLTIIGLFIGIFIIKEPIGIKIVDILILFSLIAYLFNRVRIKDFTFHRNVLDKPIGYFCLGIVISIIGAVDKSSSVISFLRHIELFIVFYIFFRLFDYIEINNLYKIFNYFIYIATIASCIAIVYIYNYGGRGFDISGISLADLVVGALVLSISLFFLSENVIEWFKYYFTTFFLLFLLILSQTRGAWLSMIIAFISIIILTHIKSVRYKVYNIFLIVLLLFIILNLNSILFLDSYTGLVHRVEQVGAINIGTIHIRLILWDAAINAFWENPFLGIGLGQFVHEAANYSSLGNTDFFYKNILGLTAHNIFLSYLAETGIIGISAFLYFYVSFFSMAIRVFKKSNNIKNFKISIPLLTTIIFIFISSFYAGTWFWSANGVQFMLFLALLANYDKRSAESLSKNI